MLGLSQQPVPGGPAPDEPERGQAESGSNAAIADACRGVRERLETIARALASLRAEIDRTIDDRHVPPTSD